MQQEQEKQRTTKIQAMFLDQRWKSQNQGFAASIEEAAKEGKF